MWRQTLNSMRRIVLCARWDKRSLSSARRRGAPPSTKRLALVSAGVGLLAGAGYGGYTHYKVNKKSHIPTETVDYVFMKEAPDYTPHFRIVNERDDSGLRLVLFQYRTCPFCCKVRAYLDSRGIAYDLVEVDAVLRQAIRWSPYKKVPILLAKVEGGYQQLMDSTAIVSILETYLLDKGADLQDLVKFYPANCYVNDDGKTTTDIVNKYFIMHHATIPEDEKNAEIEERQWRKWSDSVLVHVLSPNVYRSLPEAFQAFDWFARVGHWRDHFPAWEVLLMINGGAVAMWLISKRLKKRHNLKDDVRISLYDAANRWTKELRKKGTRFMGGDEPNLADLSVYGVLSSIEGCDAFGDLRAHTDIGSWYDAIKTLIQNKKGQVLAMKDNQL